MQQAVARNTSPFSHNLRDVVKARKTDPWKSEAIVVVEMEGVFREGVRIWAGHTGKVGAVVRCRVMRSTCLCSQLLGRQRLLVPYTQHHNVVLRSYSKDLGALVHLQGWGNGLCSETEPFL